MTDLIGRTLGRYQIVVRVGVGGMARVYKAYQANLQRSDEILNVRLHEILLAVEQPVIKLTEPGADFAFVDDFKLAPNDLNTLNRHERIASMMVHHPCSHTALVEHDRTTGDLRDIKALFLVVR